MMNRAAFLIIVLLAFSGLPAMGIAGGTITNLDKALSKRHTKSNAVVRFLAKPDLHGTKSAFVSHLTIQPGGKVPEHRDATEEYIFFLEGGGTMWIDDKKYEVKKNDLIYMPPNAKVKFEAAAKGITKVLQIFAPPGPEKKYDSWVAEK